MHGLLSKILSKILRFLDCEYVESFLLDFWRDLSRLGSLSSSSSSLPITLLPFWAGFALRAIASSSSCLWAGFEHSSTLFLFLFLFLLLASSNRAIAYSSPLTGFEHSSSFLSYSLYSLRAIASSSSYRLRAFFFFSLLLSLLTSSNRFFFLLSYWLRAIASSSSYSSLFAHSLLPLTLLLFLQRAFSYFRTLLLSPSYSTFFRLK